MFAILPTPPHQTSSSSSSSTRSSRYHPHSRYHHHRCTFYYCQFCQRRFTKSYNLMVHERSHFEIRRAETEAFASFVCDVCGKSWKTRDQLREHRSQHSPGGSSTSSNSSTGSYYFY